MMDKQKATALATAVIDAGVDVLAELFRESGFDGPSGMVPYIAGYYLGDEAEAFLAAGQDDAPRESDG